MSSSEFSELIRTVIETRWDVREGRVVPEIEKVALSGGAVKLSATMLYADLADSTTLASQYDKRVVAKIYKAFLACSSRIARACGGDIRSFDGDRVMAVFLGTTPNTSAADCALKINGVFTQFIRPMFESKYPDLRPYKLSHAVGIDTSEVFVVRAGVVDNNDLVWVGSSPNVAAKLSSIRQSPYHSFATIAAYDKMNASAKISRDQRAMWERCRWKDTVIYRSGWRRTP